MSYTPEQCCSLMDGFELKVDKSNLEAGKNSVKKRFILNACNHFTDDPELDPKLNFTFNKAQERKVRAALSNTFGFGGHNACLLYTSRCV